MTTQEVEQDLAFHLMVIHKLHIDANLMMGGLKIVSLKLLGLPEINLNRNI